MPVTDTIALKPHPGSRLLKFRGDTLTFTLTLPEQRKGTAYLRTNLGHADIARKEIIENVLYDAPPLGRDWFDLPMIRMDGTRFRLTLPLCQEGHFESKGYFVASDNPDLYWPQGPNVIINVEPADTCCANIIYNAFVRQFGPNKSGGFFDAIELEGITALDKIGYTVIPPSGTFRSFLLELDFIINMLGCRFIQLLPIYPTPTTYARMGRYGSPYASLNFTDVDPALAEFDPKATPLEQFIELVDAIHSKHAKLIIDIAINHTGWAASLHQTHPHWLVRDDIGQMEVPGAWGVRWEDLTKLDYSHRDLWQYMADIFLTWCRRGVDGFRCDAGYMVPIPAWQYIIARVREQFPQIIFLLEGLGGKISVMRRLLNSANFNWAYSELFQNYDHVQIENYLPQAIEISENDGTLVHFAETHDNRRLASRSQIYAGMRTALSALCSHQGAFGFANGVEWYAMEKINVHESPSLNWGTDDNQIKEIRRLTFLLKNHPAFFSQTKLKLISQKKSNCLVLVRHHMPSGKKLLVVINLDDQNSHIATWKPHDFGDDKNELMDLLTDSKIHISMSGSQKQLVLTPGQVFCLSQDPSDRELLKQDLPKNNLQPKVILNQRLRAKVLDLFQFFHADPDLGNFDPDRAALQFQQNPIAFCKALNPNNENSRITVWQWPRDTKREVMLAPDRFLMVRADSPFRARLEKRKQVLKFETSLPAADGSFFILFLPFPVPLHHTSVILKLSVYSNGRCDHTEAPLLLLCCPDKLEHKQYFPRQEILHKDLSFLQTGKSGSVLKCPVLWGRLNGRYDALLSAGPYPDQPANRWIMLTRLKIWIVYQDYSQEVGIECIDSFFRDEAGNGIWRFRSPVGQGRHVDIEIKLELNPGSNALKVQLTRLSATKRNDCLKDNFPVQLILRPDIENRSFHETTKAYKGPEHTWPQAIQKKDDGFVFNPDGAHILEIHLRRSTFVWEPEWQYMVHRRVEKERGLDPDSDLFSPGYFTLSLQGGESAVLSAAISFSGEKKPDDKKNHNSEKKSTENPQTDPIESLKRSMDQFVTGRMGHKTVIAGYPWFLDWGRDALIFVRGLIASGENQTAREIIKLFGQYEKNGTLPNMIVGQNTQNRDTSDTPLWLLVACSDLVGVEKSNGLLDENCGNRPLYQILLSIGHSMIKGTPTGICMDSKSGLIYSPSHFTWMDTNYPAGTPRQGFPIEIQGLWFAALRFLATIDPGAKVDWSGFAEQVQNSIQHFFYLPEQGYFSDCLHAFSGKSADQAEIDDALRPNQLLAISLGAINDMSLAQNAVSACEELTVPGAIRSLADRPLQRPLEIIHNGTIINNPLHPYQGRYEGDEDTRRKPAYHNGTAWTWMFPVFCEAWVRAFGEKSRKTALAWLSSSSALLNQGCIGHIPEIVDGNYPHKQRGCDAQAWGLSELVRVWLKLTLH